MLLARGEYSMYESYTYTKFSIVTILVLYIIINLVLSKVSILITALYRSKSNKHTGTDMHTKFSIIYC